MNPTFVKMVKMIKTAAAKTMHRDKTMQRQGKVNRKTRQAKPDKTRRSGKTQARPQNSRKTKLNQTRQEGKLNHKTAARQPQVTRNTR
jgi:hypothetical protein